MILKIIIILSFLSILSAILIYVISRKNPKRESPWKKYLTYNLLLILNLVLLLLGSNWYLLFGVILVVIGFVELVLVAIKGQLDLEKLIFSFVIFLIISFSFIYFLYSKSSIEILFFYFSVIVFDAFSQISGQLFGKNKITSISPNKTYEGLIGGFLVTILAQGYVLDFDFSLSNRTIFISGVIVCLFAFFGDLLASYYKRQVGVKDFSNLLPGQGGILDRYDSWIFVSVILIWL